MRAVHGTRTHTAAAPERLVTMRAAAGLITCVLALPAHAAAVPSSKKPHLITIIGDDVGWYKMGEYHHLRDGAHRRATVVRQTHTTSLARALLQAGTTPRHGRQT